MLSFVDLVRWYDLRLEVSTMPDLKVEIEEVIKSQMVPYVDGQDPHALGGVIDGISECLNIISSRIEVLESRIRSLEERK